MRRSLAAVGTELRATLKIRKLLIPLNAKNAKNTEFAQVRYTAGTQKHLKKLFPFGSGAPLSLGCLQPSLFVLNPSSNELDPRPVRSRTSLADSRRGLLSVRWPSIITSVCTVSWERTRAWPLNSTYRISPG